MCVITRCTGRRVRYSRWPKQLLSKTLYSGRLHISWGQVLHRKFFQCTSYCICSRLFVRAKLVMWQTQMRTGDGGSFLISQDTVWEHNDFPVSHREKRLLSNCVPTLFSCSQLMSVETLQTRHLQQHHVNNVPMSGTRQTQSYSPQQIRVNN